MKRKRSKCTDEYAGHLEHPRYGRGPRITGLNPSDQPYKERVFLHWHSQEGTRIPNTAVEADIEKQAPATIHVTHYFDSKRICRKCGANFIFFAEEQRYWYEELGFPLESDLVDCINCRKHEHKLKESRQEYERLIGKESRSKKETERMIEDGIFLVEEDVFSNKLLPKLRGFAKALKSLSNIELLDRIAAIENKNS